MNWNNDECSILLLLTLFHICSSFMIILRIILLNSSKSISPLPSVSYSSIRFRHKRSSSSLKISPVLLVRVSLTSSIWMVLLPSLSKSKKASRSFSSVTKLLLSIEATIHSENSISPFPSRSTSSKMA